MTSRSPHDYGISDCLEILAYQLRYLHREGTNSLNALAIIQ
jgi:hypothetical protein